MAFSTVTMLCNHHLCLVPKHVRYPERKPVPTSSHSSIFHPSSPWELLAPTLSWIFHIVRDHQCLASFTWHDVVEAHLTLSLVSIFNFFPWLRNISLSGYTVFYLSMVVVQYTKSCLTLCNPMDCSTLGFPVLHCLPEFAQTHVRWVSDASNHLI